MKASLNLSLDVDVISELVKRAEQNKKNVSEQAEVDLISGFEAGRATNATDGDRPR